MQNGGINSIFMSREPGSNKSVTDIIKIFYNHPSIIKTKGNHQGHFSFSAIEVKDVDKENDKLDASKTILQNDIPVKLSKANRDVFSESIMHNFNEDIYIFSINVMYILHTNNIQHKNENTI